MLDDDKRHAAALRHVPQELLQGLQPPGGGADADDGELAFFMPGISRRGDRRRAPPLANFRACFHSLTELGVLLPLRHVAWIEPGPAESRCAWASHETSERTSPTSRVTPHREPAAERVICCRSFDAIRIVPDGNRNNQVKRHFLCLLRALSFIVMWLLGLVTSYAIGGLIHHPSGRRHYHGAGQPDSGRRGI